MNTTDVLLLFTNKGNYLYCPVHELPDIRWKEFGQHIANIIPIERDEAIIKAIPLKILKKKHSLVICNKERYGQKDRIENNIKLNVTQNHSLPST